MDQLQKKSFTASRSLTWTYHVSVRPSTGRTSSTKPAIMLLHGFPDSAHLYQDVIPYLLPLGYPLLIPNLLGMGDSSKPTDPGLYSWRDMSNDLAEILDNEEIRRVIALGHDWGSGIAQRFYLFHPERCVGLVLLNVAYMPPDSDTPFDLQASLQMTEQTFGYPLFAYWELFTAKDGAEILEGHLESFWTVLHGDQDEWMKKMLCVRGAMRDFLLADKRVPLKEYAKGPKWKDDFMHRYKRDGFAAPLCCYRALKDNVVTEADKDIPKERMKINVPVLYLGCTDDYVCRTDMIKIPQEAGLLPDCSVKVFESGHWCPMEKPKEVGEIIAAWLTEKDF